MKLARAIRLDDSDTEVFATPAAPGEWVIPGTFAYSNWTEDDLTGKALQEFTHGWLGLESFGRASVTAVTSITATERTALIDILAFHFTESWGAPNLEAARPVAEAEIADMIALCADQEINTLIVLERELTSEGVKDWFRMVPPQGTKLDVFAVHGS